MKRIAGLLAIVLTAGMWLCAQDKSKSTEMTGWICNSNCVAQGAGTAACDQNCTDKSGDAVFIDDQGKVTKIANPSKVEGDMGKRVKVKGKMMKKKDMMEIYDVLLANAG
jgi:hypothetical protein